jgi:hypothetical protein
MVNAAGLTDWDSTLDVLVLKFAFPAYTAVIEWGEPLTDSVEVLMVATPEPLSVPVPIVAAPSFKVTVPDGVPEPGAAAATVAVNVTDCP